jgi:hypothetical protein
MWYLQEKMVHLIYEKVYSMSFAPFLFSKYHEYSQAIDVKRRSLRDLNFITKFTRTVWSCVSKVNEPGGAYNVSAMCYRLRTKLLYKLLTADGNSIKLFKNDLLPKETTDRGLKHILDRQSTRN